MVRTRRTRMIPRGLHRRSIRGLGRRRRPYSLPSIQEVETIPIEVPLQPLQPIRVAEPPPIDREVQVAMVRDPIGSKVAARAAFTL